MAVNINQNWQCTVEQGIASAHTLLLYRLCYIWSSGQLGAQPCSRGESGRCHVEVGTIPCSKCGSKPSSWYSNLPSPASSVPLQKTSVPWPVHGPGWSSREGTAISSSSAWSKIGQVPCYREWSSKSEIASVIVVWGLSLSAAVF